MQQQISVITLGIADLDRSNRFYGKGFGWSPVFENSEIVFYQMNGFILGTFLKASLEADMNRAGLLLPGAFSRPQRRQNGGCRASNGSAHRGRRLSHPSC
jgi:uncharacterized protein